MSVICSAGYCLLLLSVKVNHNYLSLSKYVFRIYLKKIIKINGASVSPCNTPVVLSKKGVSPSGERRSSVIIERYVVIMIVITVSSGMPYFINIYFIFLRFIVSNAFEKSIKRIVSGRFLSFTPSNIHLIVSICPIVDLFLRKPFWCRLRIG